MVRKILIPFCLFLAFLSGCRSDEPFGTPTGTDETGVQLLIPSATMAKETATRTRAFTNHEDTHDILAAEGKISNIHVFGYSTKDAAGDAADPSSNTPAFYQELTEEMGEPVDGVYRSYRISAPVGTYNIYVLTNTELTKTNIGPSPATVSENTVKNAQHKDLYVKLDESAKSLLPMSGQLNCEVRAKQTTTAYANLSFINAKVRITVINENGFQDVTRFTGLNGDHFYGTTAGYNKVYGPNPTAASGNVDVNSKTGVHSWDKHYAFNKADGSAIYSDLSGLNTDASKLTALLAQDANNYTLDKLSDTNGAIQPTDKAFIYQTICYPAEFIGAAESLRTSLDLLYGAGTDKLTFKLGDDCDGSAYDRTKGGENLKRGSFYDILVNVKEGGEAIVYWDIKDWVPDKINIQLAGLTNLFLQKTVITDTMDGETIEYVPFTTDAPRLTLESSESDYVDAAGKKIPYFLLQELRSTNTIRVIVNPALPIGVYENKTFTVSAGNVTKTVTVRKIELEDYLNVYPSSQTVSIPQIVNEMSHDIYFEYSTNCSNLAIKLTSFANSNTQKGYADPVSPSPIGKGMYLQVCKSDSVPISQKIDMSDFLENGTIILGNHLNPDVALPNSGILRLTIEDPSQAAYFSKGISGIFTATATDSNNAELKKEAKFSVQANPNVYTIHFKAINAGEKEWALPHIYVYQPLEFRGYPVLGDNNGKVMNWLEYSFTGNYAFRGWEYQQGKEPDLDTYTDKSYWKDEDNKITFGGTKWTCWYIANDWGDPGNLDNPHYNTVDFFDKSQMACGTCRSGLPQTWPGCCMENEGNGWWKIDLPLLAKPDKAMIMFVGNHGTIDGASRYPTDENNVAMPGIPLPNYSDKEAWYLFDKSRGGENCEFSDDKRESYAGVAENVIAFRWKKDLANTSPRLILADGTQSNWVALSSRGWNWTAVCDVVGDYYYETVNVNSRDRITKYAWIENSNYDFSWTSNKVKRIDPIPSGYPENVVELYEIEP